MNNKFFFQVVPVTILIVFFVTDLILFFLLGTSYSIEIVLVLFWVSFLAVFINGMVFSLVTLYYFLGFGSSYTIKEDYERSSAPQITGCQHSSLETEAYHVYVSPDGNGDGSKSSPFSLHQAKLAVRKLIPNQKSDIVVNLSDGRYNLDETFVLTPADSGNNGFFIIWKGAEGAHPVITSSKKASQWEVHDERKNIWKVILPERTSNFEHLWLENGTKLQRAWSGFNPSYLKKIHRGFKLKKNFNKDFHQWEDPYNVVLIGKHMWYYLAGYVDSFKENKLYWSEEVQKNTRSGVILKGNHSFLITNKPFTPIKMSKTVAIENAYELINEEGEWYFNNKTKVLYLKPPKGFTRDSKVIYPKLKTLVKLDGQLYNPIENIIIKNLHFRYNNGDKVSFTASYPAASVYTRPKKGEGALQINAGKNIWIENNSLKYIGNDALNFDLTGQNITINANSFETVSSTAISIVQSNLKLPKTWYDEITPENKDKMFKNIVVSNNYLHNISDGNFRFADGIAYSELVKNILITHNEIDGVAGCPIRNSWRYGAIEGGHAQGVIYSWNKSQNHVNKEFHDFAALSLSCANGLIPNSIHHNYIIGIGRDPRNIPVYLDVHVSNTDVYNNVMMDITKAESRIFGPFWVYFVGSRDNRAFNNWIEGGNNKERHFDSKNFPWYKPRNEVFDNTFYKKVPDIWPREAQEVIDKAGLEPRYEYIKEYLNV